MKRSRNREDEMSKLSAEASGLMRAGRTALDPTDEDHDRVLKLLEARLGVGVAANPPKATVKPSFATAPRLWVALGVPVVGLGIAWSIAHHVSASASSGVHGPLAEAVRPSEAVPPMGEPLGVQPAPSATPPVDPAPLYATHPAETAGPVPRGNPRGTPRPGGDTLSSEVALLGQATLDLNQGQPVEALAAFEEHERRFPAGALAEERMAGEAEALCALGRTREAKLEVSRLTAGYPGSSHLKHVRTACGWGAEP
jgi:hypothetical protein